MPDFNVYSYLAYTFLSCAEYELRVLKSSTGWYIGATDENNCPVARDSVEYYESAYAARAALTACTWTQRSNP